MTDRVERVPGEPGADARLVDELASLGHALAGQAPQADLVDRVMARVSGRPDATVAASAPVAETTHAQAKSLPGEGKLRHRARRGNPAEAQPRHTRSWRTRIALVLAALAGGLVLVPPVRATVLEWIRIGGVTVAPTSPTLPLTPTTGTASTTTSAPRPSSASASGGPSSTRVRVESLGEARTRVDFPVGAPASLGDPTEIAVSQGGRVVEMLWGTGETAIRLEVFAGSPDYGYFKTSADVEWTVVDGHTALWLPRPHELRWLDRSGSTHSSPPRVAGPTLVWAVPAGRGEVTYRLEGVGTVDAAVRLASTVAP